MAQGYPALMILARAIAAGDTATALALLAASPELATARLARGATRQAAKVYCLDPIGHYFYAGQTALHVAAAAYQCEIADKLITMKRVHARLDALWGADVRARDRRGAEPLHYAAVGAPGSLRWNPNAQAAMIARLIAAGADPNAGDMNDVAPLHRAVRTRCAAAVRALLDGGADPQQKNGRGSTPMALATRSTGRGGSGSPEAKAQQMEIVRLLEHHGARR
jgi:ankyrin repeat protein